MNKLILLAMISLLVIPFAYAQVSLFDVKAAILEERADWTAGETSVSPILPKLTKQISTYKVSTSLESNQGIQVIVSETLPSSFDWRNKDGVNWMTPVKDQSWCGSCWDFAAVAAAESKFKINTKEPNLNVDLSEQHILSCNPYGNNCIRGGDPRNAVWFMNSPGVVDEECFPYTARDDICSPCSDWQNKLHKVVSSGWLDAGDINTALKEALIEYGPVIVVLNAPEDLYYYRSGIYSPVIYGQLSDHAVTLVGYDDADSSWIIKNSWGTGWGENGYGRVKYGILEQYYNEFPPYIIMDTDYDNDGVNDTVDNCPFVKNPDQIDVNHNSIGDYCECIPNWVKDNNLCLIIDSQLVTYTDINNCNKAEGLPADNGTYAYCDKCTPEWTAVDGDCQDTDTLIESYSDVNNCFATTGLVSDLIGKPENKTHYCDSDNNGIIGKLESINTNLQNIKAKIGDSENLLDDKFTDIKEVVFSDENNEILKFNFNFTLDSLNLANISIQKQDGGNGSIIIKGLVLPENETKTIFMDKFTNSSGVCIKDEEISLITEITDLCKGLNETYVTCPGLTDKYNCEIIDGRYKISGLTHSGIKEQIQYCGNNLVEGTEECDGTNLNGQSCSTKGYSSGALKCTNTCTFDISSCSSGSSSGGSSGGNSGGSDEPRPVKLPPVTIKPAPTVTETQNQVTPEVESKETKPSLITGFATYAKKYYGLATLIIIFVAVLLLFVTKGGKGILRKMLIKKVQEVKKKDGKK